MILILSRGIHFTKWYNESSGFICIDKENQMKANIGGIDRILRILVGIVLIALTLMGTIGVWGWIGVVPLLTGIFKFCPLYPLLGISTDKK